MYKCELKEFGVKTYPISLGGNLFFEDKYGIQTSRFNYRVLYGNPPYLTHTDEDKISVFHYSNGHYSTHQYGCGFMEDTKIINYRVGYGAPEVDKIVYSYDDEKKQIVGCDENKNIAFSVKAPNGIIDLIFEYKKFIYAVHACGGGIFCYSKELKLIWEKEEDKQYFSVRHNFKLPSFYEDLVLVNFGEREDNDRGNFEINAYKYDTGEIVWQNIVETSPESSHMVDGKLYVCAKNHFRRIDALTGSVEVHEIFDCRTFDGELGTLAVVYPIGKNYILCSSAENHILEIRTLDAKNVIQTITLPESYCYSGIRPPVFYKNQIYLALGHVKNIPFNLMKAGIAILSLGESAKEQEVAVLEEKTPHVIEKTVDDKGNNAHKIRVSGSDADKIIHDAHVILKELAVKTGVAWGWEFEGMHDPSHAGKLYLEIDVSQLEPKTISKDEWLEKFSIIKERVDEELFVGKVAAGNKKNRYRVILSII